MNISNYLKEDFCVMDVKAGNKNDAINEIALQLAKTAKIKNVQLFVEDILERESLGSTGIGHNIAIPHARTDNVEGFVIGFGRVREGLDFKSIDERKVHLIFLMGAQSCELNLYLRLLAELSKLLMNPSFRRELMDADSAKDIIKIII